MAAKCDVCRKMANKYQVTSHGDVVCGKVCMAAYRLESYLLHIEERRSTIETHNQKAIQHAKEMEGWLSVFKHGNAEAKARAGKIILNWQNKS